MRKGQHLQWPPLVVQRGRRLRYDEAMRKLAIIVGFISLATLACGHTGAGALAPAPASIRGTPQSGPALSGQQPVGPLAGGFADAADDGSYYQRMAHVLEIGDVEQARSIDFARLRRGSMLRSHAAGPPAEGDLRKAMKSRDEARIAEAARAVLAQDATYLEAHIVLVVLDHAAGRDKDAALHDIFAKGIVESMGRSGNGRSMKTAFRVFFVREEYDLMRIEGCQVLRQSLTSEGGKSFDILRVKNEKGVEQDVYFDITELFAEEAKLFGTRAR